MLLSSEIVSSITRSARWCRWTVMSRTSRFAAAKQRAAKPNGQWPSNEDDLAPHIDHLRIALTVTARNRGVSSISQIARRRPKPDSDPVAAGKADSILAAQIVVALSTRCQTNVPADQPRWRICQAVAPPGRQRRFGVGDCLPPWALDLGRNRRDLRSVRSVMRT